MMRWGGLFLIAAWTLFSAVSCGGGTNASGGIGGSGISMGTITGFGSVFVNGVEFDSRGAAVTVDGKPASEGDLDIGMVVTVEGSFNGDGPSGAAERIDYAPVVHGTIDAVDPVADVLMVLGKTVLLENDTVYEGITPLTLKEGQLVDISGYWTADGSVRASRVAFVSNAFVPGLDELVVTGEVQNLNPAAGTFTLGSLTVDFSGAETNNIPGGSLSDGLSVRVRSTEGTADGILIAARIEALESVFEGADGLHVDIEGIVTQFSTSGFFELNGIPVRTNSGTVYELGEAEDIEPDAKLAIEGVIDSEGVLQAARIEFRGEGEIEIEAPVQSVDPETGTLVLMGAPVEVTGHTILADHSDAAVRPFGLGDLRIGDWVVAVGDPDDGFLSAVRLERRNPGLQVGIDGPVTAVENPVLEVFGVSVVATADTQFQDSNGTPISPEEFFTNVGVGSMVGVDGNLTGNTLIADEIEYSEP